jgi:hypothetical protein
MKRRTTSLIPAILLLVAGGVQAHASDGRGLPKPDSYLDQTELFETVCDLPAHFAQGLIRAGGGYVVADRHEDTLVIFDSSGKRSRTLEYPAYEPSALSFDGEHYVVADGADGRIYFIDPATGECVHRIESPISPVTGLACDDHGRLWVSARHGAELQLVDPGDGTTLASIKAPTDRVTALAYDADGYLWVADATQDRIYLVDIRTGYTIFRLPSPGPVPAGLWYEDGTLWVADYQTDQLYSGNVGSLHGRCVRSDARRGKATLYSEVQDLGPGRITGGTIVLAIPENGPNQDLESVTWSDGSSKEKDQWGQEVAVYELPELEPGHKMSVELEGIGTFYEISYKIFPHHVGTLDDIPEEIRRDYLVDADKYRVQGEYIQNKVKEVVGNETNVYFIARKLYDFLIGRINYQMVGGWDIAPTVIERGTGSCSEYTFSYVSLCRAAGIPARYVGAMVLRGEDASIDTAYHRWAEIYLPGVGWIPVDVNAGDREWQGDRCFSFGGIANRFLITTRGGGDSEWLGWGYNSDVDYRTQGKANVRVEGFAEWDVVE